jgi:hypothetical protein
MPTSSCLDLYNFHAVQCSGRTKCTLIVSTIFLRDLQHRLQRRQKKGLAVAADTKSLGRMGDIVKTEENEERNCEGMWCDSAIRVVLDEIFPSLRQS